MITPLHVQICSPCLLKSIDQSTDRQPVPEILQFSTWSTNLNILLCLPYYGIVRVWVLDSVNEYLPAMPKGRPKKNAVRNLAMTRIRRRTWKTTHGAPVSHGEEFGERVEWDVAARTFGIVASKT